MSKSQPRSQPSPAGNLRGPHHARLDHSTDALALELTERVRSGVLAESTVTARLLGVLAAEVQAREASGDRFCPRASLVHLSNLRGHPDVTTPDLPELRGATCLDFGCGGLNPLGGVFGLLLAGAGRGLAIDLDDVASPLAAVRALSTLLGSALTGTTHPPVPGTASEILARVDTFDLRRLAAGDPGGIDDERLRHMQVDLRGAGIADGAIDVVVSNSVFEHLDDVDGVLDEMARIVRPGGLAVHAIDGFDHRYYGRPDEISPHAFLFESSDAPLLYGCNRIRPLAFAALFEQAGFEVRKLVEAHRTPLTDDEVARLDPAFRDMPRDHLEVTRARYYLRRR
ncbi:MAG: methyltransferase domain-containing protein [Planctomycetota bacterium]|nr:methyltransferase domain-containing protein [Planctomycetota bacterium]MDA0934733.1 methyltransferase domain-containing protein [Planctomycetota bacterium]